MTQLDQARRLLEENADLTLAVVNGGERFTSTGRGVRPLYDLLTRHAAALRGAAVADKVIGRGAAALMALGGVTAVTAPVVSKSAMEMLTTCGIAVETVKVVSGIINRRGTGPCPVEQLTAACRTPEECLPLIEKFLSKNS